MARQFDSDHPLQVLWNKGCDVQGEASTLGDWPLNIALSPMSFIPSKRLLWFVALVIAPVAMVLGMVGVPGNVLLLGMALVVAAVAMDAVLSWGRLHGVSVVLPSLLRTSKGKRFELSARVEDRHRRCPLLRVGLAFPRELEAREGVLEFTLAGADSSSALAAQIQWSVLALERGPYRFERAYIETPSGLGFWEMRGSVPCVCEVRVYPDLNRERHVLAPLFLRRGALGVHQVRQLGKGREFEQLRSYAPGDSYGDIYWKGTAKRRLPVTMMYQIERTQEMHVIIDVSRRSARPLELEAHHAKPSADEARFAPKTQCERFIQTTLVLALAAEQQNDRFGMMTFSDQVHTTLPAGGGRAHYNACREVLYTLQPRVVSPDYEELFIQVGNKLRHRSLLIILTDLGEPWLSESFAEAVRHASRKHVVLVHVLGSREFMPLFGKNDDITHADDLYRRLAGHLMWSDLQETTRGLKQCGVHLTSSMQESLVADVVSEYLKVKKRQLV